MKKKVVKIVGNMSVFVVDLKDMVSYIFMFVFEFKKVLMDLILEVRGVVA